MAQHRPITCRRKCRGIGRIISDVPRPSSIVVSKLAEQLSVVDRGVCDDLELLVGGCQEPEYVPGLDCRHGVLTTPKLRSTISITKSLQSSSCQLTRRLKRRG